MNSVFIVAVITVSYIIKILSDAQLCVYGKYASPATMNHSQGFIHRLSDICARFCSNLD